jgi:lipoate-protein ligase A
MTAVRLLPWRVSDGATNMALDESMLASAIEGVASLRFYGWTAATLSLGYFQPHAPARAVPELAPLDWVRRPTGGLAIVHHLEITYALALPAGLAGRPPERGWVVAVHEAVRAALAVESRLCVEGAMRGEVLCFLHHTPGDVMIGDAKVVGSAQRKGRGALLQHGSILLRRSPHAPQLPGIEELIGKAVSERGLCMALLMAMQGRLGWAFEAGEWTAEEERYARELSESRYRGAGWNERR